MSETSNGVSPRPLREPVEQSSIASYKNPLLLLWRVIVFTLMIGPSIIYAGLKKIFRRRKDIKNEICLVTGAGRGLGRGIAIELSKLGAVVICVDINETNNKETVRLIKKNGGQAAAFTVNVSKIDEVTKMVESVEKEHGPIDILVNNAGLVMGIAVEDWTPEEIISSFNVNVLSHYWSIKACIGSMRKRNKGHIVTMSSLSALTPPQYMTVYGATKAAIAALSQALREELELNKDNKIKVTNLFPFFVNTSADYTELYEISVPVLSVDESLKGIMDAILFEKYEASIPSFLHFFSLVVLILPRNLYKMAMNFADTKSFVPDLNRRKNMPYYEIVTQSTAPIEGKTK